MHRCDGDHRRRAGAALFPHQVVAALTGSMSISIQLNFEIFDILYI
jgi:hypothetical protein